MTKHGFGNIDKFRFQKGMKTRLESIIIQAYKQCQNANLANDILLFKGLLTPINGHDSGRLPAGNLLHPVHSTKCRFRLKDACYLVDMRNTVQKWWEYVQLEEPTTADDKMVADVINGLSVLVKEYDKLIVRGDARTGWYTDTPEPIMR